MNDNPFDDYTLSSLYNDEFEQEELIVEIVLGLNEKSTDSLKNEEKFQVEEKSSECLVLKEFPKHLKYAFLGKERSKPVILAVDLTIEKE